MVLILKEQLPLFVARQELLGRCSAVLLILGQVLPHWKRVLLYYRIIVKLLCDSAAP